LRSEHIYVTLKVYETGHRQALNEHKVMEHLEKFKSEYKESQLVRTMRDNFELQGKKGTHACLVYDPLGLSFEDLRSVAEGKLPERLLKPLVQKLLIGLNFLHSIAHVVHTGTYD
jgi:serine/threonine-protein kinase SRPK3